MRVRVRREREKARARNVEGEGLSTTIHILLCLDMVRVKNIINQSRHMEEIAQQELALQYSKLDICVTARRLVIQCCQS